MLFVLTLPWTSNSFGDPFQRFTAEKTVTAARIAFEESE
jgi:hypothetical protein